MDEGGTQVNPLQVVDGGKHSISEIQKRYLFDIYSSDLARFLSDMMFCRCCCVVYGCVDQFMRRKYSNPIVLINRHMTKIEGGVWNRAKIWQDHCFIDQGDSNEWAGNNYSTYFVQ